MSSAASRSNDEYAELFGDVHDEVGNDNARRVATPCMLRETETQPGKQWKEKASNQQRAAAVSMLDAQG